MQAQSSESNQIPGEYIVTSKLSKEDLSQIIQREIGKYQDLRSIFPELGLYKLKCDCSLDELRFDENLGIAIKPNLRADLRLSPNDPGYLEEFHHQLIQSEEIWELSTGNSTEREVVIACMDAGFDLDHEDLINAIYENPFEIPGNGKDDDMNGYVDDISGFDFRAQSPEHPESLHGTSVLGAAGAEGDNGTGVAGVLWQASVLPLSPSYGLDDIVEAMNYVYEMRKKYNQSGGNKGAAIVAINQSFGFVEDVDNVLKEELCPIYELLLDEGVLCPVATPNRNQDMEIDDDYPSWCPSEGVISVNATDEDGEWDGGSGFGNTRVDIAAPSKMIYTTGLDDQYVHVSGTSLATPIVTAAIGLLYTSFCDSLYMQMTENPRELATQVKNALLSSAKQTSTFAERNFAEGYLQIYDAHIALQDRCNVQVFDDLSIHNLFPNPLLRDGGKKLYVQLEVPKFKDYYLEVYDLLGKQVYDETISAETGTVNIEVSTREFQAGVYILRISDSEREVKKKFLVSNIH